MCLMVHLACIVRYLFMNELYKLITILMHLNLMHQRIKPKVPGRLVHSLCVGEHSELLRQCKQQTRVFAYSCSQ